MDCLSGLLLEIQHLATSVNSCPYIFFLLATMTQETRNIEYVLARKKKDAEFCVLFPLPFPVISTRKQQNST